VGFLLVECVEAVRSYPDSSQSVGIPTMTTLPFSAIDLDRRHERSAAHPSCTAFTGGLCPGCRVVRARHGPAAG
jgi:hypothetical protein